MKNFYEIAKGLGIEIPEDKKEELNKAVAENYKTVAEVDKLKNKITALEEEKQTLQKQYEDDIKTRDENLVTLQDQLKGVGEDKEKMDALQKDLAKWQKDYEASKKNYEAQLGKQAYEFAVREKANELKFSSNSAKKAFLADLMSTPLQMKEGQLLGFDDFVKGYKEQDAGAFITEASAEPDKKPTPTITTKSGKQDEGKPAEETIANIIW